MLFEDLFQHFSVFRFIPLLICVHGTGIFVKVSYFISNMGLWQMPLALGWP